MKAGQSEVPEYISMNSGPTISAAKVVLFARADGPLRAAVGRSTGVVEAASAYEAAAELLTGPTAALVVDLPLLTPYHCRLLRLAGDLGVPVLGVGAARRVLRCEDLHPLRRVGLEELGGRLAEICREFELSMSTFAAAGEIEAQLQQESPAPAAEAVRASPAAPAGQAPANAFLRGSAAAARREEELAGAESACGAPAGGTYVSDESTEGKPPDHSDQAQAAPPALPSALLSEEELSALLGDEP